jgi:hypothetical protein
VYGLEILLASGIVLLLNFYLELGKCNYDIQGFDQGKYQAKLELNDSCFMNIKRKAYTFNLLLQRNLCSEKEF